MPTLLHEQQATDCPQALADPAAGALWLDAADIARATGWLWKPEGLCQGDVCLPLPPADRARLVRDDGSARTLLDIAGFWRHAGQPVVHDSTGSAWVLGTGAAQRSATLQTLEAPDFTLPDLAGRPHRLRDLRGRKVFLASWASW